MSSGERQDPTQDQAFERAQQVKQRHEARLLEMANVVGVGIGQRRTRGRSTEQVGLVVMVSRKLPRSMLAEADLLPGEIEGVPVDVQEVGTLQAQV